MRNILICGSSGFVGENLRAFLLKKGFDVRTLDREIQNHDLSYQWPEDTNEFIAREVLKDLHVIINLAGANIGQSRWTRKRKKEILKSRAEPQKRLLAALVHYGYSVDTYLSSSAVGYYGAETSDTVYLETDKAGDDFLSSVCQAWEEEVMRFQSVAERVVIFRKGVVIGPGGGMYKKLFSLAVRHINTCIGKGEHYLPWIYIKDLLRLYEFSILQQEMEGVFNVAAPQSIRMKDLSRELALSVGKRRWTPPAPLFAVRLLFGEMSDLLSEGSRVHIGKLLKTGFNFQYSTLKKAFEDINKDKK